MSGGLYSAQRAPRLRRSGGAGQARRTRGVAAILLLLVVVIGSMYVIVTGLDTASAAMRLEREAVTADALKQAKEGLVAWAARHPNQPGALPCPDTNNDGYSDTDIAPGDGVVDSVATPGNDATRQLSALAGGFCANDGLRVGRLPWRTLGLPDLRDANGERLWYALSDRFRVLGAREINSDTLGQLTIVGDAPAAGVVAIVLAPGRPLGAQVRDGPAPCAWGVDNNCRLANYFEGGNAVADTAFEVKISCERADAECPGGYAFNDQLALVTHEELFRVVEAVVQTRLEREIAPQLSDPAKNTGYFQRWGIALFGGAEPDRGFFPFAAPYDPTVAPAALVGQADPPLLGGLLPVSRNAALTTWKDFAVAKDPSDLGPGTVSGPPTACNISSSPAQCTFKYTCLPFGFTPCANVQARFTAKLGDVHRMLLTNPGDFLVDTAWLMNGLTGTLQKSLDISATGGLVVALTVTLPSDPMPDKDVVVEFPAPTPEFAGLTDPNGWFVGNGWHRQTYYAVSDGFRPRTDLGTRTVADGCLAEPATPACLRVINGPPKARAALVLAGRNLVAPERPRSSGVAYRIEDYFERENRNPLAGPAPVFERGLRSSKATEEFNDRVVVVATHP